MRRWLAAHRAAKAEARRVARLLPRLEKLYGCTMTGRDVVDAALRITEGLVDGDYRLAPGKKAPPPFEGAQA